MPPLNGIKPKSSIPKDENEQSSTFAPMWLSDIFNPNYRGRGNGSIPLYWSMEREYWLRWFYENADPIKLAITQLNFIYMAVPLQIKPNDPDDKIAVQAAEIEQELLQRSWANVGSQFIFNWALQDNGAWLELTEGFEGDGRDVDPSTPLEPTNLGGGVFINATGLNNLDSLRCQRTSNDEYPVIYHAPNGKMYKMHHTRIINYTNMPSSDPELLGIGMSPISSSIDSAITMDGAIKWSAERVGAGALPNQMIFGVGFDPELMEKQLEYARLRAEDVGNNQYQKVPFIINQYPSDNLKASDMVHSVKMDNLPADWNLQLDWNIWWDTFALAVGIDSSEFRRATTVGETKAEAALQDEKGDQKGKAYWFKTVADLFTNYFCSENVNAEFDFINDRQDEDDAKIFKTEQEGFAVALENGILTKPIIWRQMLEKGQITQDDYEELMGQPEEEPQPEIEEVKAMLRDRRKKKDLADDYQATVDSLVEQAINGEISQSEFEAEMLNLIEEFGTDAFVEGANIDDADELTEDEQDALDERLAVIILALLSFSDAIYRGAYDDSHSSAMSRAALWGNSIQSVSILGQTYDRSDPVLEWRFTPGKEHCTDCATFNGQRKRASEWRAGGKLPRTSDLACRGYNCGCSLIEVR